MASIENIYMEFGRLGELCQLFETELGTALLVHDALETKAYLQPNADAANRVQGEIAKRTLGATLKSIRSRFDVQDDLSDIFERALAARNTLMHGFFLHHGMAIHSDAGRDAMILHMRELRSSLEPAYQAAGSISQIMIGALQLMKKVHAQ